MAHFSAALKKFLVRYRRVIDQCHSIKTTLAATKCVCGQHSFLSVCANGAALSPGLLHTHTHIQHIRPLGSLSGRNIVNAGLSVKYDVRLVQPWHSIPYVNHIGAFFNGGSIRRLHVYWGQQTLSITILTVSTTSCS